MGCEWTISPLIANRCNKKPAEAGGYYLDALAFFVVFEGVARVILFTSLVPTISHNPNVNTSAAPET